MSRSRHTEAQIIAALKQMEAGRPAAEVAREVGVAAPTLYQWKANTAGTYKRTPECLGSRDTRPAERAELLYLNEKAHPATSERQAGQAPPEPRGSRGQPASSAADPRRGGTRRRTRQRRPATRDGPAISTRSWLLTGKRR